MPIHARYFDAVDIIHVAFLGNVSHEEVQTAIKQSTAKLPDEARAEILDFTNLHKFDVGFSEVLSTLRLIKARNRDALWDKSYYLVTGDRLSRHVVTMITSLAKVVGAQYSIDVHRDLEETLAALDLPETALAHFTPAADLSAQ